MSSQSVRASYAARTDEYVEAVGRIEHIADPDLALVREWALSIDGLVLDVGCGPGQWTHYLSSLGVDAEGIDPVAEFIESAQKTYPAGRYRLGQAEALDVHDGAIGGVLAWYSLIHAEPDKISAALEEFARCIRPGGGLALGFFTGPTLEPFKHAIAAAYNWPLDLLKREVENAGFIVTHTESRTHRPERTHGAIIATRA